MNYLETSIQYKVRKFLRYTRMYGLSRTWIKYISYKHEHGKLPGSTFNKLNRNSVVSIVGAGKYSFAVVAYYMRKHGKYALRNVYDPNHDRRDNLARYYKGNIASSVEELLDEGGTKLLVIASNHYTHAPYAVQAIERGINVHIEKPHAVNFDQLNDLTIALKQNPEVKVNLGYNRPKSELAKILRDYLGQQEGSLVINWFVAGHEIEPDHWYFDEKEGGRVLGNLVHWIDYTMELIGLERAFPIQIIPTRAESSDSNIVVSYVFGDGSIATISFSAKGHTFDGVREYLNIHKGDLLVSMRDYKDLTVSVGSTKRKHILKYRDHGHRANVENSLGLIDGSTNGTSLEWVYYSGYLSLMTKKALDTNSPVSVHGNELSEL